MSKINEFGYRDIELPEKDFDDIDYGEDNLDELNLDEDYHLHHIRTSISKIYENHGIADIYLNDIELEELVEQLEDKIRADVFDNNIVKIKRNSLNQFKIFKNLANQTVYSLINTENDIIVSRGENFIEVPVDISIERNYTFQALSKYNDNIFIKYDNIIAKDMCISIYNYSDTEYTILKGGIISNMVLIKDKNI